jgi:hypothetical protein
LVAGQTRVLCGHLRRPISLPRRQYGLPNGTRTAACWHRSREAYIEAGRLLCSAKAALQHGEFEAMVATLPFKILKAEMLMEIYRDQRLANPQYVALLPNDLGALAAAAVIAPIARNAREPGSSPGLSGFLTLIQSRGGPDR